MKLIGNMAAASAATTLLLAPPASAHHSMAMFEFEEELTLEGTVKEFQWTNPHSWIQVLVEDPETGEVVEWSVEAVGPVGLRRRGWERTSLTPGDAVSVVIHPMKSGDPAGALISVTVNGVTLESGPRVEGASLE